MKYKTRSQDKHSVYINNNKEGIILFQNTSIVNRDNDDNRNDKDNNDNNSDNINIILSPRSQNTNE